MSLLETASRLERRLRPLLAALPPALATRVFSAGRTVAAHQLVQERPLQRDIDPSLAVHAWGLTFRMGLWNAAGMFKDGRGYDLAVRQGAGAFIAGTTTSRPRAGNMRHGIQWPTVAYERSHSASNWMGLPNPGHAAVARTLASVDRVRACPIGVSVAAEPGLDPEIAFAELIEGLRLYERAGVDLIEINESCPNTDHHRGAAIDDGLHSRLERISAEWVRRRQRPLPVVVKFSVDTDPEQLPSLISTLVDLEYDGILLGNTSTQYARHASSVDEGDRPLYDYFTKEFGGGLSGRIVRADAAALASAAHRVLENLRPQREFHVIRCGGISGASDIVSSQADGIRFHQWYTGYYEAFAEHGHDLYLHLASELLRRSGGR